MSLILATLFSRKSSSAGLMIYDLDSARARCVQLIDFSSLPVKTNHIRGMSISGNRLYVLVPCAMLVFRFTSRSDGAVLDLEKVVCRPEWVLGQINQGNLHAIFASQERERVYVSFNTQNAIDIFDLEGNFLQRKYLWEVSPERFPIPEKSMERNFQFGIVKHIFVNERGELILTVAAMNGNSEDSALINFDNGDCVLNLVSEDLHGGMTYRDHLFLCAIQKGRILSFPWNKNSQVPDGEPVLQMTPEITDTRWHGSDQKTRGLAIVNRNLICGVCFFGKEKARQIPPRMVAFDLQSGDQIKEYRLPSFQGFEEPHVYALLSIPRDLEESIGLNEESKFYHGNKTISPIWVESKKPPEKRMKKPVHSSDSEVGPKNNQKKISQPESEKKDSDVKNSADTILPMENHRPEKKILKALPENIAQPPSVVKDSAEKEIPEESPAKDPAEKVCPKESPAKDSDEKSSPEESPTKDPAEVACPNSLLASVPILTRRTRPTVILQDVGLCFERAAMKFLSFNKKLRMKRSFWALRNVSFSVHEGETLGVIGRNGSGKSTLSMICSGVLIPDQGTVNIFGQVQLLALGVGFNNELSGRENIFINGSLLGLSKKEIKAQMNEIESFAELGEFIDEPVRTYSSGMRSRLGFAVATAVKPEILILDEIMATGDKAFQDKAIRRMREMQDSARSVIVVSHNPGQLRKIATRVLWLEKGRIFMQGDPNEVLNAYNNFCQNPQKWFGAHPAFACQDTREEGRNE